MEKDFYERLEEFKKLENEKLSKMTDEEILDYLKQTNKEALNFAKEHGIRVVHPTEEDN